MQDLKFYILIEGNEKESEVRIDGNLAMLRKLLHTLHAEITNSVPVALVPADKLKYEQGENNVTH